MFPVLIFMLAAGWATCCTAGSRRFPAHEWSGRDQHRRTLRVFSALLYPSDADYELAVIAQGKNAPNLDLLHLTHPYLHSSLYKPRTGAPFAAASCSPASSTDLPDTPLVVIGSKPGYSSVCRPNVDGKSAYLPSKHVLAPL